MTNNIVFIKTNGHWLLKLFSAPSIVSFILIEVPDASSVQTHPHLACKVKLREKLDVRKRSLEKLGAKRTIFQATFCELTIFRVLYLL
jgi:hypothetical protein